jgi:hypothetical protein
MTPGARCSCGRSTRKTFGTEIYPHRRDLAQKQYYICFCGNYTGCHQGTWIPLGIPADASTRMARVEAHEAFNRLYINGLCTKTDAYTWLAEHFKLPKRRAHIGHFDIDMCREVIKFSRLKLIGLLEELDASNFDQMEIDTFANYGGTL